ncbi:hypothetical protein EV182_006495, partial [Spiromyces aspiralis]
MIVSAYPNSNSNNRRESLQQRPSTARVSGRRATTATVANTPIATAVATTTTTTNGAGRANVDGQQPPPGSSSARPDHERRTRYSQPAGRSDSKNYRFKDDKKREQMHVGEYIIQRTLGKGSFSKVCLAEHRTTKQLAALKFIKPKSS